MSTAPQTPLEAGQEVDGFVVRSVTPLESLRLTAVEIDHPQSGARVLHLHADDAENLFSISFPTPPPDDTGVPHILEHVVLGGSRKFPVRDPFFEMVKMSMATFINAMTGWDCTYYPVASNVRQDLFNLADVYFDAVFHPLMTERTFKREGHHLAPADKDEPTAALTTNGIVYSEMKGAFSNPEARLFRAAARGLFPDTAYGRESGGDPQAIPDLTYDDFRRFQETFYHPSNAYIVLYGDIPTTDYLDFLRGRLADFRRTDVQPVIDRQARWETPRDVEDTYPIGADEDDAEKTYMMINWIVGRGTDAADVVAFQVLGEFLLGNEAAPLRKAVIDSKLGQDLIYSGYSSMGLEATFRVGLKGSEADRAETFVRLVLATLGQIADGEIERDRIEAAFRQTAYAYQEVLEMYPLHLTDRALNGWRFGLDALTFLRMREHLDACRQRYEADATLFNGLIRQRLLDNPHRLTVVLRPDRDWQRRTDEAFAERMRQAREGLSDEQMRAIAAEAEQLEAEAGTPNPPEALAKLPQLKVADLPDRPKHVPTTVETIDGGVELLHNDVFANGVNYLELSFDLRGLPQELWAFLPRYVDAVQKLGAAGMDYEQIARRTAAHTGGIRCSASLDAHATDPARSLPAVRIATKALDEQMPSALALLGDLLFAVDPRDADRLRDVMVQARARYRTTLVHQGAQTAVRRAARGLTVEAHLDEVVRGLAQLDQTGRLTDGFDEHHGELMDHIEALRDFLLARGRLTVSFTGSDAVFEAVRGALSAWIARMSDAPVADGETGFRAYDEPPREGLAGPIQIAHCARVMPAPHYSHEDEPLLTLAAHLVSYEYLLPEIRLKGNAYGFFCAYDPLGSAMKLSSFRDPHVARTLGVYQGVGDYVRQAHWSQDDVDRAIIGVARRDERPIRPENATHLALRRHRTGQTRELREARFERIRSARADEVRRAMLEMLDANFDRSAVCVVAGREKLEDANRQMPGGELAIEDILK